MNPNYFSATSPEKAFCEKVFKEFSQKKPSLSPLGCLIEKDEEEICRNFDATGLQESWSWRNVHFAKSLACLLIDEKGKIIKETLEEAISLLKQNLFSLGPERQHDDSRFEHILALLFKLKSDEKLISALKKISHPEGQRVAQKVVRETLGLDETETLTDAHARQAALAALFTKLRQNVGSCFATAPAILIHEEQPERFLADISLLLATGRLTRIFEGKEYTVPLSLSSGVGDLYRPFFLSSYGDQACEILSHSPGLQAAFLKAGIVEKKSALPKHKWCEELLQLSPFLKKANPLLFLTPDHIIRSVLLAFYSLKGEEVEEYQNRPTERARGDILIQPSFAQDKKSLRITRFLKSYDLAKTAFIALTDNALLKAWEFTLASLSESKADFAKWNLYASLGFEPEEPFGIGASLHAVLSEKIESLNKEIESYQTRYDIVYAQLKSLEGRAGRSDADSGWIQAEFQTRKFELHRIASERDELYEKGRLLSQFLPFFSSFYIQKFQEYFQEVYDADMHDVTQDPYDDSPAGFRLLYKHGRHNPSLWTLIGSASEFLNTLSSFFVATEVELLNDPHIKEIQQEVGEFITVILNHLRTPEFLESAFQRLAKAYREPLPQHPLENLAKVKRKPWSYISGGTMSTLISTYFGAGKPEENARWVESELELLVFYLDCLKEAPRSVQEEVPLGSKKGLLAFSPTHAFLLKPGMDNFWKSWQAEGYPYTWIRDTWIAPQEHFFERQLLDFRMLDYLLEKISLIIPQDFRGYFKNLFREFNFAMSPREFRERVLKILVYEKWIDQSRLRFLSDELDSLLFSHLPLFSEFQLKENVHKIFDSLNVDRKSKENAFKFLEEYISQMGRFRILSQQDLLSFCKALLIKSYGKIKSPHPIHSMILQQMRKESLAPPPPILFADTNWVKNVFGFTVNPGTGRFELWRFDESGSEGRPMSSWSNYLNGTDKEMWGVYTLPYQYR